MEVVRPHPANVSGDFFVEDGCCLTCDVPFNDAPDLFAWFVNSNGGPHCYVKKQPLTPDEHKRMFTAISHAETGCIRYGGRDRTIQQRLVVIGEGSVCVDLPPDLKEQSDQIWEDERRQRQQTLMSIPPGEARTLADMLREARGEATLPPFDAPKRRKLMSERWQAIYRWLRGET